MTTCLHPSVQIVAETPQPSFVAENATLITLIAVILVTAVAAYITTTWLQRGAIIAAGILAATVILLVAVNTAMTQCPDRPEIRVHDENFEAQLHDQTMLYRQPIATFEENAVVTLENHTVRCVGGCDAFTINNTRITPSREFQGFIGLQPCHANHTIYVRGPKSDAPLPVCDIPERLTQ